MASNTNPTDGRGVLAVAVTALLVASTVAAGVSLAAVGTVSAQTTQVSSCTTIDQPGTYELAGNVTADEAPCIEITASDVTLDGDGYAVSGDTTDDALVLADASDDLANVTVRDVRFERVTPNIDVVRFDGVSNGTVADVRATVFDITSGVSAVAVTGDDNTVTGVSGSVRVAVVGDDNQVVDAVAVGNDYEPGVSVDGDANLVRNVTARGIPGMAIAGADNRVANSTAVGLLVYPGVRLDNATGVEFVNNTVQSSSDAGLVLANSTGATVAENAVDGYRSIRFEDSDDNTVRGNWLHGQLVLDNASSNLLYDNYVNATATVEFEASTDANRWNVTPRSGENVVGGDMVAGNYYANPEGTGDGYSQTCEDADGDGLCDSPNELAENNTDYHPLAEPTNDTDDGNDSETNDTYYQVDFVAGQPIEELGEDGLYAQQDRLMRFAFGETSEGITEKDTAWPNESIRSAVDYGHITEHDDGTASVTFTVADGETVTLSLVTYSMPNETFEMSTVDQQELLNSTTETYGPGEHTVTVSLPDDADDSDE